MPKSERTSHLRDVAYGQRDELQLLYLEARIKADAARMVADRGEGEDPLSLEEAEIIAEGIRRSDALVNARAVFEDLPEGPSAPSTDGRRAPP